MITALSSVLMTSALATSIFWWNTARGGRDIYGELSTPKARAINAQFNKSVLELTNQEKDSNILIFGEAMVESFSATTQTALSTHYSWQHFFPYNIHEHHWGIWIFAKSIPTQIIERPLDYLPPNLSSDEQRAYRARWMEGLIGDPMSKIFLDLHFDNYWIIPVHLLQPWQQIREKYGTMATMKAILTGQDHPLFFQLQNLISEIETLPLENERYLVLGDFNFPRTLLGISTLMYKQLASNFVDINLDRSSYSFPTKFGQGLMAPMLLDQSFSTHFTQVKVIKLQGSDHFPILVN